MTHNKVQQVKQKNIDRLQINQQLWQKGISNKASPLAGSTNGYK